MSTKSPLVDETLTKAFEKAGGDHKKVAAQAGVSNEAARKWKEGTNKPRGVNLEKLMAYVSEQTAEEVTLTGTPSRRSDTTSSKLKVYGTVSAGLTRIALQEDRVFEGVGKIWRDSVYRRLTHGEVIYLEVKGSSMEPDYPDGCFLACAKPCVKMEEIPALTPVIARAHDEATFKLYRQTIDRSGRKEVELLPLNRSFHIQRFGWKEVEIDYIALGFINPWKHGLSTEPKSFVLRESR